MLLRPEDDTERLTSDEASTLEDDQLWEEEESSPGWFDNDTQAFLVSMMFHVVLILALAIVPLVTSAPEELFSLSALPVEAPIEEFKLVEDIAFSEEPSTEVGANSNSDTAMALSTAPVLADISEIPAPTFDPPSLNAHFDLNNQLQQAVGLVRSDVAVKGMTGVGTTGTDGAVDRITYEILKSMEERPTLVVWLFDQSGSLQRRREEIRARFDRIYEELGILSKNAEQATRGDESDQTEPVLSSVIAFGQQVSLLTKKPTADIDEIRDAIDSIEQDVSGVERIFSAMYLAVKEYKTYRSSRGGKGPQKNVIFIAVTDERGDDAGEGLETTISECRKYAIPVYVVGVPAPFGRDVTYVKYVDPDPKYDQTPQWAEVDQGPESLMPERVKLGYKDNYYDEPVIDSGFGPYALSRLAYETGGIYFTVHPNRQLNRRVSRNEIDPFSSDLQYFFDPEVMVKYRPDYETTAEYMRKIQGSPLRQSLVNAAQLARTGTLESPEFRFIRRDEASLANLLTTAQQQAARLEPQLASLLQVLSVGAEHRDKEPSPRWLAGYDLAYGTVMAHKVRAEGYNAMLAKAKRGMAFEDPKNNTWVLRPDKEISVGSKLEKEGQLAVELLTDVSEKHQGTPWGFLASRELRQPVGWKWVEEYTDLNPPRPNAGGNNNPNPTPPQDDKARMLKQPPPKRPVPKL